MSGAVRSAPGGSIHYYSEKRRVPCRTLVAEAVRKMKHANLLALIAVGIGCGSPQDTNIPDFMTGGGSTPGSGDDSGGDGPADATTTSGSATVSTSSTSGGNDSSDATGNDPVQYDERLLYVLNDGTNEGEYGGEPARIDIFDIDDNHALVRSIDVPGPDVRRFRGVTASPDTEIMHFTDSDEDTVVAFDLSSEEFLWEIDLDNCDHVDRLNVTLDGTAVYVPCKASNTGHAIDAMTGETLAQWETGESAHNTFIGELGKYVYFSSWREGPLQVFDPKTHEEVFTIDGWDHDEIGGIRPFSVTPDERYVYTTHTELLGFAVLDVEARTVLHVIEAQTPEERTQHESAQGQRPHGGESRSHGIAVRPGAKEVWVIDDEWGYLYVYDITELPPKHLANVELFDDIEEAWGADLHWRWVFVTADGEYVYPGDGQIVDADTKQRISERITPSEKLIEIDRIGGDIVRVSGQNGGVYHQLGGG
jgi:hypothetical protein